MSNPASRVSIPLAVRDPFAILGVSRDATPDEIRAAYRELARRHHPDATGQPDTARRFAEIAEAYEHALERASAPSHPKRSGHDPDDPDPGCVYDAFFGRDTSRSPAPARAPRPHPFVRRPGTLDLELDLPISDRESSTGFRATIPLPDGSSLTIERAPGTAEGETLTLTGHGVRSAGGVLGDLIVRFRVVRASGVPLRDE